MDKQVIKDGLFWGFIVWFIGYVLGIVFFAFVPPSMIGWTVMPIGIVTTLLILFKKIKGKSLDYFLKISIIWTIIAIIFDYLFLVMLFKPEDGYYKLDVYIYYVATFVLPILVGWRKKLSAK